MTVDPQERTYDTTPAPAAASESHRELTERLFREHNEALIRFLLTRVRSHQEASEVAQEAYVRLLSLDKPGAVSYLRAFLYKTAANLAVDRLRRNDVHERATASPLFQDLVESRSPERHVASLQDIQQLERILEDLPPKCRQAFVLNRCHGMDFVDIAREMQLSERMVRTYVVRALLYCRARLDATDPQQEQP